MNDFPVTLYCPNLACQTANAEANKFCHLCGTALPRQYLWVVPWKSALTDLESVLIPGKLLGNRYFVKHPRIVLDTKPGWLPQMPLDIDEAIAPYLRLMAYRLHLPEVYGLLHFDASSSVTFLLLESSALTGLATGEPQPLPRLVDAWPSASPLRQLHWLWQIAHLWQPLLTERVASSLLDLELLRVQEDLVRLLALQPDAGVTPVPSLVRLGELWARWLPQARSPIQPFLRQLSDHLIHGKITSTEHLIHILDQALKFSSVAQTPQVTLATQTDRGPSRSGNEDACYPPSGTQLSLQASYDPLPLVVVCDGIGGHEGGEVASQMAIATLETKLKTLCQQTYPLSPEALTTCLEDAVFAANDLISDRNDQEHRLERKRMGTTVVLGWVQQHELYLAHVGDSRAYRITRSGCYQVTLDDDLASREVRLGYALYRDALQHPVSGSLVQALGMRPSNVLSPTVQRFVLDEDCLFLLCSDGLSDYDRIEAHWESELLPVLSGDLEVGAACQRLVDLGNRQNGHDNVTVGLIHCRVTPNSQGLPDLVASVDWEPMTSAVAPEAVNPAPDSAVATTPSETAPTVPVTPQVSPTPETQKTTLMPVPESRPRRSWLWGLLSGLVLLGIVTGAAYSWLSWHEPETPPAPTETPIDLTPPPPPPTLSPTPSATPLPNGSTSPVPESPSPNLAPSPESTSPATR